MTDRPIGTSTRPAHEAPSEGAGSPPYVLAGFGATFDRPWLPALIHWPVPAAQRPAALAADHPRRPTGIERLDVEGPVEDVAAWCGGQPSALHCEPGRRGPRAVTVGFADGGTVVLGAAGR